MSSCVWLFLQSFSLPWNWCSPCQFVFSRQLGFREIGKFSSHISFVILRKVLLSSFPSFSCHLVEFRENLSNKKKTDNFMFNRCRSLKLYVSGHGKSINQIPVLFLSPLTLVGRF